MRLRSSLEIWPFSSQLSSSSAAGWQWCKWSTGLKVGRGGRDIPYYPHLHSLFLLQPGLLSGAADLVRSRTPDALELHFSLWALSPMHILPVAAEEVLCNVANGCLWLSCLAFNWWLITLSLSLSPLGALEESSKLIVLLEKLFNVFEHLFAYSCVCAPCYVWCLQS